MRIADCKSAFANVNKQATKLYYEGIDNVHEIY